MVVVPFGIVKDDAFCPAGYNTNVEPFLLNRIPEMVLKQGLVASVLMAVRLVHLAKAAKPMFLTLAGIVMDSKLVQDSKA